MTSESRREPALPRRVESGSGLAPALAIDAAVRDLVLAMADLDGKEREAAILLLTEAGEAVLPALLRALHADQRDVRLGAVHACQVIGDERMLPHVRPLILDADAWVRWAALDFLFTVEGYQLASLLDDLRGPQGAGLAQTLVAFFDDRLWEMPFDVDFVLALLAADQPEYCTTTAVGLFQSASRRYAWRSAAQRAADRLHRGYEARQQRIAAGTEWALSVEDIDRISQGMLRHLSLGSTVTDLDRAIVAAFSEWASPSTIGRGTKAALVRAVELCRDKPGLNVEVHWIRGRL
ncbi:MAG: HEAT repeat domain-containing protein [Chloroflexi bacterium]|nr:HEAT repeat domain-containing protein [Chloroflexota bacterium]